MTGAHAVISSGLVRHAQAGKIDVTPDQACAEAEDFLLKAGFVFSRASRLSEARYFKLPGRFGVLRLATHKKASRNPNLADGPTIASITFSAKAAEARGGFLKMSTNLVEWQTATAIGIYILRAPSFDPSLRRYP